MLVWMIWSTLWRRNKLLSSSICAKLVVSLVIYGNDFSVVLIQYPSAWPKLSHCKHHTCRIFSNILDMVVSQRFYHCHVKLPAKDKTPPEICNNPKLYPFFCDCLGVVDGTHIDAFVPDDAISHYRNWKGVSLRMCLQHAHLTCGVLLCPEWVGGKCSRWASLGWCQA